MVPFWWCTLRYWLHSISTRSFILSWGLENIGTLKHYFENFPTYMPHVVGKLLEQHFNVSLFYNPIYKVLIFVKSRGQICPIFVLLFRNWSPGLENNDTLKCWSDNFLTPLIYVLCWKGSMYHCSPIQGQYLNSCYNFMKRGSQSATYAYSMLKINIEHRVE